MSSFINDEKGVIEPYTELPAMALAVVGFIVFFAILTQAYTTYEEKSFLAGHYQDAANLARKLSKDSSLTASRPGTIDPVKLENLDTEEFFKKYGSSYDFIFRVDAISGKKVYSSLIMDPDLDNSRPGISASIPVTVRFNDVEEEAGTLTVKIMKRD